MKYLRKYNESNEQDLDFIIAKIKDQYSEDEVKTMFDKEVKEWTDDEDHDNEEAKDVILTQITGWFESKYSKIAPEVFGDVYSKLQSEYKFLNIY